MRGISFRLARQFDFTDSSEPYHDLALVIEGEKLHVSKQILAFQSPVFKAMFYGDFVEKNMKEIELNDVIRGEFIELLHMIYPTGKKITDDSVAFILKLGDRFQMQYVIQRAEVLLMDSRLSTIKKLMYANEYRLRAVQ
ncbi:hypothetical protein PMAYCL1PPCAC_25204, partial [Pristionchus mayeri]